MGNDSERTLDHGGPKFFAITGKSMDHGGPYFWRTGDERRADAGFQDLF